MRCGVCQEEDAIPVPSSILPIGERCALKLLTDPPACAAVDGEGGEEADVTFSAPPAASAPPAPPRRTLAARPARGGADQQLGLFGGGRA